MVVGSLSVCTTRSKKKRGENGEDNKKTVVLVISLALHFGMSRKTRAHSPDSLKAIELLVRDVTALARE